MKMFLTPFRMTCRPFRILFQWFIILGWLTGSHLARAALLSGTVMGTDGSWNNSGNTITNVFDGDINTFFDAPDPGTGDWVGLDFGPGAAVSIDSIVFAPRNGFSGRMVNGVFQGANLPDFSDSVVLATINTPPPEGVYSTFTVQTASPFRFARYLAPDPSWGNISELQFFGHGTGINLAFHQPTTASTQQDGGHSAAAATDGNLNTAWISASGGSQWIVVDLGTTNILGAVRMDWGAFPATAFSIQVSLDGTRWAPSYSTATASGGSMELTFKPVAARYVRLLCTVPSTGSAYSVNEWSIFGAVSAASVAVLPATSITSHSAILSGQITATGGLVPSVTVYYGIQDGGTNGSAWTTSVALGATAGAFSTPVGGLIPQTPYFFTVMASNAAGVSWTTPSAHFTTASPPLPPALGALTIASTQARSAWISGQVQSTGGGGETPEVYLFYGTQDGGTNAVHWQSWADTGPQTNSFTAALTGLLPDTHYYFTAFASNSAGVSWITPSQSLTTLSAPPAIPVVTYHYDNTRQGANLSETELTPTTVGSGGFGKLFSYPVDGHVYAQPLLMTNVVIPGKGTHNVLYVATQHDSLYAFDADSNSGPDKGLLWHVNFGVSAQTPNNDWGNRYGPYHDINPEVGITATPVIDPVTSTIYLDVFSHEGSIYLHRIHALDLSTGLERPFSPVPVAAQVKGRGVGSAGGVLNFDSERSLNRAAFTLAGGILFATYTGYADTDPYHGWVIGFDAATLKPLTNYVFNTSPNSTIAAWGPNAGECGIWMAGHGLCVDAANNLYFEVGNGPFNANVAGGTEYGDSFVRLSTSGGLSPADYFTPFNQAGLSGSDADLGSGGPMLLPDEVGSPDHPHLLVGCGKEGKIYLLDRDNMGHYNANNDNRAVQTLGGAVGGTWSSPAYFDHRIYYQGQGDVLKCFAISNAHINPVPVARGQFSLGYPGCTPVVSANGNLDAIVWTIQSDAYGSGGPAILRAYNATNIAQVYYDSSRNRSRDNPGGAVKYTVPVVANGKVYVPAQFAVSVYGVAHFLATPTINPPGGTFTNSVLVTLSDATPGTQIYYTIDGSTPGTNSILYTGPFVLTNNTALQAVATQLGAVDSGVAQASFLNLAAIGDGNGLLAEFWNNHSSADPFAGLPDLVRLDPTVDFNWTGSSPDPAIGANNFTARWSGSLQAQFSESYTIYASADDGVRVLINGNPIINQWVDQAETETAGQVTLRAGQRYTIEMDYYQAGGEAAAHLSWSSRSTPKSIIPLSQLFPATNPPPGIAVLGPDPGSTYTAPASITWTASAATVHNGIDHVSFYLNRALLGTVKREPFVFTATDISAGTYSLSAVVVDASNVASTSAPVQIHVVGSQNAPYGIVGRPVAQPYYNLPPTSDGPFPTLLSQTGVFSTAGDRVPRDGFIPYQPASPFWSDGALKSRYFSVPYQGYYITPEQQISFSTNGEWAFPAGSVFVKNFDLVTDETHTNAPVRRLETRLLVRNPSGSVYGLTYRWKPDNSDAELLTNSVLEDIRITNAFGVRTQTWYYPSQADCLTCHTPAANYVLGLNTRQLNYVWNYPTPGSPDNQLRTLNHLGLFNPAFDEAILPKLTRLVSVADTNAPIEDRVRSYLDSNCSYCHRPGGVRANFDARYDTPLAQQNIIHGIVLGNLGVDRAQVVTPQDLWRSVLYQRMNTVDSLIAMPPLARNRIDHQAVSAFEQWINNLPGTPALPPPTIDPLGGQFDLPVQVAFHSDIPGVLLRYTLDDSLPTAESPLYSGPFSLSTNAIVQVKAFADGYSDSIATLAYFTLGSVVYLDPHVRLADGIVHLPFNGVPGRPYVLQSTTDFRNWIPLSTNSSPTGSWEWTDSIGTNRPLRFYRAVETRF